MTQKQKRNRTSINDNPRADVIAGKGHSVTSIASKPELLSFALIIFLCLVICIADGVYPFGDNCILHVDMYHQYCPFFTEFRRKLVSGESLMYSWNIGLGSDFISVFVYYLASPFNWLLLLCPETLIIEFMTVMIVIKMALSGASFCYFLRKRFADPDWEALLVFSLGYAFCGFMAAYNWDIMWLDSVALAPLIVLGLHRLVKEGRSGLYYVALALSILCNYYISIMICIFLVFDFAYLFLDRNQTAGNNRWKAFARFTWYSLLAGGTGIVLMLPEMLILSYSGSSGISFPDSVKLYYNILAQGARMSVTGSLYTGNDHWPNLYTGAFAIFLFFCFCQNRRIAAKEKICYAAMTVFMYISFDCNVLDWFWHGLHYPDSLPGRQAFLYSFLLLTMGYHTYLEREALKAKQIMIALVLSLTLVIAGTVACKEEITEKNAGELTCILIILYAVSFLWDRLPIIIDCRNPKEMRERIDNYVKRGTLLLMVAELTANMAVVGFYTTGRTRYLDKMDPYHRLIAMAQEDAQQEEERTGEKVFYRIENTERKTKNDACLYGYQSTTQFSSLMNVNVSHFFQQLFMEGGKNYYCYNGSTPVSSAMLSVRYVISDNPYEASCLRTLVGEAEGYYLYRNLYTAPLGFVLSEDMVNAWEQSEEKKVDAINSLGNILGAREDTLTLTGCLTESSEGYTTIRIPEDGYYYASSHKHEADTVILSYENGKEITYSKASHTYLFDLGECGAGDEITVKNTAKKTIEFDVYKLNTESVDIACGPLCEDTMSLESYNAREIVGNVAMQESGRLIISVPAEDGWTLYVDGGEREIVSFDDTFISVPLEQGEHHIELIYETPGLKTGALASLLCVIMAVISLTLPKYLASYRRIQ